MDPRSIHSQFICIIDGSTSHGTLLLCRSYSCTLLFRESRLTLYTILLSLILCASRSLHTPLKCLSYHTRSSEPTLPRTVQLPRLFDSRSVTRTLYKSYSSTTIYSVLSGRPRCGTTRNILNAPKPKT